MYCLRLFQTIEYWKIFNLTHKWVLSSCGGDNGFVICAQRLSQGYCSDFFFPLLLQAQKKLFTAVNNAIFRQSGSLACRIGSTTTHCLFIPYIVYFDSDPIKDRQCWIARQRLFDMILWRGLRGLLGSINC